jgi:chitin disaccharide deacetylase
MPGAVLTPNDVAVDAVVMADEKVKGADWKQYYLDAISKLKPGLTEIIVHVGHDDAELQAVTVNHDAFGSAWRARDLAVLTSPEFRRALSDNQVILVTWRELGKLVHQP